MGMEYDSELSLAIAEIRKIDGALEIRDGHLQKRFEALESSIDDILRRQQRPGAGNVGDDATERKQAVDYCVLKHDIARPKIDTAASNTYTPGRDEIANAMLARKAIRL